jgi:hypothetical protein
VRAKDEKGVWGPWSATWSFTVKAPNYPVDLAVESGVLRLEAQSLGQEARALRVYGSDEKGFSVSDQTYTVSIGSSKELKNRSGELHRGDRSRPRCR